MITNNDIKSLAHTKWNCKYHIVFAPKFRRKVFYESKRLEIGKMIRELCKWKEVNLIEGEVCLDHVHILVEIPPKLSVSSFMGFLKGKTSIMIYQKYGNMKFKYRNRNFWCRGYYVDTAGKDAKKIQKYIQDQLKEDEAQSLSYASLLAITNFLLGKVRTERSEEQLSEQLTLGVGDPFMGSK